MKSGPCWSFETRSFSGAALLLAFAWVASVLLKARAHTANLRVTYALIHLPAALLGTLCFLGAIWISCRVLSRNENLAKLPSVAFLLGIALVFCLFWLPPLLAGGFDSDDWMLLSAAAIRKSVISHPWLAWQTLDSVDGNFRPLTALYFGLMLGTFGLHPLPFLAGVFLFNLASVLIIFPVVRELGYGRVTASAAALLYLSRSLTYTLETWMSALGDVLVILLCGLSALCLLRAIKRRLPAATALHLLAWALFFLATLAKQSAYAFPLIAGLILSLRPGKAEPRPLAQRLRAALLGTGAYAAGAAVTFFHARALTVGPAPYPLGLSPSAALRTLSYLAWWFGTFEYPYRFVWLRLAPDVAGGLLLLGGVWLLRRLPGLWGDRPGDMAFCFCAAFASLSLFVVLATRGAAYYGSMAAFWFSIAVAIALTRLGSPHRHNLPGRIAAAVFCGLLLLGFLDVRLQQTGLIPSGGYTWGTSGSDFQGRMYSQIREHLETHPQTRVLQLTDMPGYAGYFTGMAMLADPALARIVTHQTRENTYSVNDLDGKIPIDGSTPLNDPGTYNWTVPLDRADARRTLTSADGSILRLRFQQGKIERED